MPNMEGEAILATVAQIALALAGFSGVVSVFQSAEPKWRMLDLAATEFILEHAFAAAAMALLPFPLFYTLKIYISGPSLMHLTWRMTSIFFAAVISLLIGIQIGRIRDLSRKGLRPRRAGVFKFIYFPLMFLSLLLQLVNAIYWASFPGLLWVLLVLLLAPGFQFLNLVRYHLLSFLGKQEATHE
jgi:hypothetical protein